MSVVEINKAAFEGDLELLQDLLDRVEIKNFAKLVDPADSNRGPLHFGILGKRIEVVRVLLDRYEFSPSQLDEDGWSPLHIAASIGNPEIIELLVKSVANLPSSSPEDSVTLYCNKSTQDRSKQFPLHLAAAKGHEEATIRLICHGAKVSNRNAFGQTALHRAACAGKPMVVAALLESNRSCVDWKDFSEESNTALHLAAEDGHFEVVELLVDLGQADKTILNAQNKTPLQVAQNEEIREFLSK